MSIRSFIALNPDKATVEQIQQALEPARSALAATRTRWVAIENWHLTLGFLGNIDVSLLPALDQLFEECTRDHSVFPVRVTALVPFPAPRRPRMIAAEIEASPPLTALYSQLTHGLEALGFPPEQRRFRPHITLARLPTRKSITLPELPALPQCEFEARQLILYASELGHSQPVYTPMLSKALADPTA